MDATDSIFLFYKYYFIDTVLPLLGMYWWTVPIVLLVIFYLWYRLRTKRYYFVRHGKTILNAAHIKQGAEGKLTDSGREQADHTGAYLTQFGIQKIYSSTYERTVETSEIINQHLKVKIEYTPLLVERRNPSEIVGKSYHDVEVKKIVDLIDLSYHRDDLRYSDEENFEDLKERARKCLNFLSGRREHRMAVVTHGFFLKMLLSYILNQEGLHNSAYVRLSFFNTADNGGVTICEYTPWKRWFSETGGWKILTYNLNLSK